MSALLSSAVRGIAGLREQALTDDVHAVRRELVEPRDLQPQLDQGHKAQSTDASREDPPAVKPGDSEESWDTL